MNVSVITSLPAKLQNTCLIVPVFKSGELTPTGKQIDKNSKGAIAKVIKQGDFSGAAGDTLLLLNIAGVGADRVILVGAGDAQKLTSRDFRKLCKGAARAARKTGSTNAISSLTELPIAEYDMEWKARQSVIEVLNSGYQFTGHSKKTSKKKSSIKKWSLLVESGAESKAAKAGVQQGSAISAGCGLARDLGNLAPNICTPAYLANQAKSLQKQSTKLKTTVLEEAQMKKLGMGALLSVSQGSRRPAKLICMEYKGGGKNRKPIVLVGKGITFDTGGISLKPGAAMDEMKYDMCGAASVFGAIQSCIEMNLKCNVVGIVPTAENMPDGDASRPGDVVTTMSGQTVEILNTDAEGRLILCDALTWAEKFKPAVVIDIATLTGACVIALGHVASGLMANDDDLAEQLHQAGEDAGDRTWRLPIWDEYQSQLDSNFADIANIGGRSAGSITAGCFLARFTKNYTWAHLDIAGIAWLTGKAKGATGRPVPLLMQYLLDNQA